MDKLSASTRFRPVGPVFQRIGILAAFSSGLLSLFATPVLAHHAMGGKMPANFFEGLMAGVAHPVIGPDHFAFVVAVGLLAAVKRRGIMIPIAFLVAAMLGTIGHLARLPLPGVELWVSGSIVLFGWFLISPKIHRTSVIAGLAALAGLFHGYAYGEAIFGSETTPLLAYLTGFTLIQSVIVLTAFWLAQTTLTQKALLPPTGEARPATLRSAGLLICGAGMAFFASQLIAIVFPIPHV